MHPATSSNGVMLTSRTAMFIDFAFGAAIYKMAERPGIFLPSTCSIPVLPASWDRSRCIALLLCCFPQHARRKP